ncbi:DUF6880 family protein [Brevundimonas sp. FT23028]|uniref:DUF6880 family protein n=1 Tax=Brevundimonas sp. FT23028 TaxID=3393748 RepID=UPI003B58A942
MAKRPSGPKKTLTAPNLAALGADRLAGLLMEVAGGDALWKRRLRMELAGEVGAADLALELDKRLTSLGDSRVRVSWRKRPELIRDLQSLRRMIVDRLAPLDARLAFDRMVSWFDLYPGLTARVKDPKGELGLLFDGATGELAALASALGPEGAAPVLSDALATRLSEWASWIGRGVGDLSPAVAAAVLAALTTDKPRPIGRLALVVRKLAERSGDLDAWISAIPDDDRTRPEVGSVMALRLAAAGRPGAARAALEASRTPTPEERWLNAEIAVLEAEGRATEADEARWMLFERTLSPDALRAAVARLPDFEDVVALDRAFAHAAGYFDPVKGLAFLMNWPALREAADMIETRAAELRGGHEDTALWAARLSARHPRAALILLRARARTLVRLGGDLDEEVVGLIHEAESLATLTGDDGHAAFVSGLRRDVGTGRLLRR